MGYRVRRSGAVRVPFWLSGAVVTICTASGARQMYVKLPAHRDQEAACPAQGTVRGPGHSSTHCPATTTRVPNGTVSGVPFVFLALTGYADSSTGWLDGTVARWAGSPTAGWRSVPPTPAQSSPTYVQTWGRQDFSTGRAAPGSGIDPEGPGTPSDGPTVRRYLPTAGRGVANHPGLLAGCTVGRLRRTVPASRGRPPSVSGTRSGLVA